MENAALLVIDMQNGLFEKNTPVYKANELLAGVNMLSDAFHAHSLPVFLIRHTNDSFLKEGTPGWQLHDLLHIGQDDVLLTKSVSDSFQERCVVSALEDRSIKSVCICGLVTHGCVKAACLGGLKRGYKVTLASDAHSSFHKDAGVLIGDWNVKLADAGVTVLSVHDIIENL
jgi:nicotinamidase-related amidase